MTEAKAEKKKSQRWNDIDGVKEEGTHYGIKDHLFIYYPFIYAIFIFFVPLYTIGLYRDVKSAVHSYMQRP